MCGVYLYHLANFPNILKVKKFLPRPFKAKKLNFALISWKLTFPFDGMHLSVKFLFILGLSLLLNYAAVEESL